MLIRCATSSRRALSSTLSTHDNSLAAGPDGRLYGLFPDGIFSIDATTYEARVEAFYRGGIVSAGFALSGRDIYFASGPRLVRYTLP
jgi:hypothetical protein